MQGKVVGVADLLCLLWLCLVAKLTFLIQQKANKLTVTHTTRTGRLNGIADQRLAQNSPLNQSAGYESALPHPSRNCFAPSVAQVPAGSCIAVSTCACAKVRQKHDMYFANCLQHDVHPSQLVCTICARLIC